MKDVVTMAILTILGVICIIFWHKKIDSDTTYVYGIYVIAILIFSLFALIKI